MTDNTDHKSTQNGAMLQAAFSQLQLKYRAENRHTDAHMVNSVAAKLTNESAERVLWIMLDIMAGRRDARGKRTMIEPPNAEPRQLTGTRPVRAITHQGSDEVQ